MTATAISIRSLPPSITLDGVRKLSADLGSRQRFLRQLIKGFERRYACSLEELNRRLNERDVSEHPTWEDSIEWGNALEQLAQAELMQAIATWLINSLKPSPSS